MTAWEVVGLDLSLASTGIAARNGTALATIKPTARAADPARRLHEIVERVGQFLDPPPQLVVIEGVGRVQGAARGLLELHGVVKERLFELGVAYAVVPPASLKKWATGKGNADKDAMVAAAFDLGYRPANDDEADAACLRSMAVDHLDGVSEVEAGAVGDPLSRARVVALRGVVWPLVVAR